MRADASIDAPCGFVVTLEGLDILQEHERCECQDLLAWDGALRCRECGTVYGVVTGYNRFPRRRLRSTRGGNAA
jgi:hypothetical protein